MKRLVISLVIFIIILAIGVFFVFLKNNPEIINEPIPTAQVYSPVPFPKISSSQVVPSATNYIMPSEINLAVPFTVQAPHANWSLPYKEFCEEASSLMAASYIYGWDIPSPDFADQKLLEIKSFEEQRFGYYLDTTAEETAIILKEFYNLEGVKIIYDPTENDIKKALSEKKIVIMPAAGQQLGNPYFTQPGPLYHMLVIKGYTKDGDFITNDPGTRRGADYIYSPSILLNANHDWNGGDVEHGRKVIIIVG